MQHDDQITVRLPSHQTALVGALADQEERSVSAVVRRLLAEALAARGLLPAKPAPPPVEER